MLAYDWNFLGLSTETKPTSGEKVVDGSTFYECDTSSFFIYYDGEWYQQTFVTEDGINFWLYKTLMKKMFGKLFDSNISKGKIIKPTTGTEIEFTTNQIAQITDLTGYGDTFQQTYSGANLFNYTDTIGTIGSGITVDANGFITCTFDNSAGSSTDYQNYFTNNLSLQTNTNYAIVAEIASVSGQGSFCIASGNSSSSQMSQNKNYDFSELNNGDIIVWVDKTKADFTGTSTGLRNFFAFSAGRSGSITVRISVIADTSVTPQTFVYQPFTGNMPSPNPDYPQAVNVVTGTQTITISDGMNSHNYTVNLGPAELCKIGAYQDYIYKSGDDWYMHKETEKLVADGSEAGWSSSAVSGGRQFYIPLSGVSLVNPRQIYCDRFYFITGSTDENTTYVNSAGLWVIYKPTSNGSPVATSTAGFQTWLSTHNTTLYYTLATSTDTKITDNTLISNLNSLLNYIFPVGDHQIVITADDLPMALKLTITEKE